MLLACGAWQFSAEKATKSRKQAAKPGSFCGFVAFSALNRQAAQATVLWSVTNNNFLKIFLYSNPFSRKPSKRIHVFGKWCTVSLPWNDNKILPCWRLLGARFCDLLHQHNLVVYVLKVYTDFHRNQISAAIYQVCLQNSLAWTRLKLIPPLGVQCSLLWVQGSWARCVILREFYYFSYFIFSSETWNKRWDHVSVLFPSSWCQCHQGT